ncbi:arylesterase [Algoriphagus halophytocola]|uniref:Arylesterase n=1 Tax=Algoriphagus halophytocola TaxID=2991499 RepID=A0ABY6MPX7_9BACT|nr:arylesterase [Algoriphagus sp. TR-M5]UZD24637.1 arylesterase [Algoriphagus sp. TR-M5]
MKLNFKALYHFTFLLALVISASSCAEKKTETSQAQASKEAEATPETDEKIILFFGNSLTAGYGIEQDLAFPGLIQDRLDSLGKEYKVINGGLSGETTAGGVSRLDWFLEDKPDIFVLELGGNDGLRGIAISETKKNLGIIIDKVQEKYPDTEIILAGMQIPPNMGPEYSTRFAEIYPEVAQEQNVTLIPFLLENVGGINELNLPDGIHPTEEGHKIVSETVWTYLKEKV